MLVNSAFYGSSESIIQTLKHNILILTDGITTFRCTIPIPKHEQSFRLNYVLSNNEADLYCSLNQFPRAERVARLIYIILEKTCEKKSVSEGGKSKNEGHSIL